MDVKADQTADPSEIGREDRRFSSIGDASSGVFGRDEIVLVVDSVDLSLTAEELGRVAISPVRKASRG